MKKTEMQMFRNICFNCFKYIYENEKQLKQTILDDLKEFARHYSVNIKKTKKMPEKTMFMSFLNIDIGFKESINRLYWSIAI